MTGFWTTRGASAGLDRLAIPGRTLDPAFVTGLEVDAAETVRQTGGDVWAVRAALDGLHEGLAWAAAGAGVVDWPGVVIPQREAS